jgi:hypothetical protein
LSISVNCGEGAVVSSLLAGYSEVTLLPDDTRERLDRTAVLIAVRQLVRWRQRWGTQAFENRWFGKIAARTRELVAAYRA